MNELNLRDKTVLIREDFNVPLQAGKITNAERIKAALPTLKQALAKGANIILCAHLGRPTAGQITTELSLQPIADYLSQRLAQPVPLIKNWPEQSLPILQNAQVVLLENIRFHQGETNNDPQLSQQLAALCDIFVMDAFACAHRQHASTHGVARFAKTACAGPLLCAELDALAQAMRHPKHPIIAIVGGAMYNDGGSSGIRKSYRE